MGKKSIILLGVTGGIGSGKSEVCHILEDLGAVIFDSDKAAKKVMATDGMLIQDIVNSFGNEAYWEDGSLNNQYLSDIVFRNKKKLQLLNSLVHPYVFELFRGVMQSCIQKNKKILVKEAALIFETGAEKLLDAVLVIDAPIETRIQRVMQRSGLTHKEVELRMRYQMSSVELTKRADYVIENSGGLKELERKVQTYYKKLVG